MAFSSERKFKVTSDLLYPIVNDVVPNLESEGYQTKREDSITGGVVVTITKGGMFKAVLGMKTALKIVFSPEDDCVKVNASVGIFGQQAIPTMISMLVFWPILITQVWGLIKQSNLDQHVYNLIQQSILEHATSSNLKLAAKKGLYCPNCGAKVSGGKFCAECGGKL